MTYQVIIKDDVVIMDVNRMIPTQIKEQGIKMDTNNVETMVSWYAPDIGTVKTETYDDKNKPVSGSVLTELKGK